MSNKGKLPEVLFVAPIGMPRHKIRHKHVLFYVEEYDKNGLPLKLRYLSNEDKPITIEENMYFITAYVQEQVIKPNKKYENAKSPPFKD